MEVQAANTSYYVDCSAAGNGNGTQASPWNTLTSVNKTTFGAGDQILFKRGATCTGTLSPKGSGGVGSPLVMDAYGSGNKPIIAGNGATDAVFLYNQQYIEIRNLEVTNNSATASNRRGIYIVLENFGIGQYYRLTNLSVHNVKGTDTKDGGGSAGIMFEVKGTTTQTKFNDVILNGNEVFTIDRSGIIFWSSWQKRPEIAACSGTCGNWYPATNIIIRNNTVYDVGGDGIVPHHTSGALVERNVVHDFQVRSAGYNAGIWGWNIDNAVFQYNEAYNGNTTRDGMGFDIDEANTGVIYQYNYSHDNAGGFFLFCNGNGSTSSNGIVRYNISQNDRNFGFTISCGKVTNMKVYNNILYVSNPNTIVWNNNASTGSNVAFYNNIFYVTASGASYSNAGTLTFDYNVFAGQHPASEPSDAHKLTSDPLFLAPGSASTGRATLDGYKLRSGSPALSSGLLMASNGGLDYWGNTVSVSAAPNRGAYGGPGMTNLLVNPGWEAGVASPWTAWNASVVASNARTGTYAARVGTDAGQGSYEQMVTGLQPNTTYRIRGWVKAGQTGAEVRIGAKSFGGTEVNVASSNTAYTEISTNFTTGSANTSAVMYCWRSTNTAGFGYCDDMVLEKL